MHFTQVGIRLYNYVIRVDRPFVLYGLLSVQYSGRAESTIGPVNLLLMSKKDGSFVIHAAKNIGPANYQGPKSALTMAGNKLRCENPKGESIVVTIHKIKFYKELEDWTLASIKLHKTEQELCDKIEGSFPSILADLGYSYSEIEMHQQFPTKLGPVDVCAILDGDMYHVTEVKARKITMAAVHQLRRYMECFDTVVGHLAAPTISPKAEEYVKNWDNIHYTPVDYG